MEIRLGRGRAQHAIGGRDLARYERRRRVAVVFRAPGYFLAVYFRDPGYLPAVHFRDPGYFRAVHFRAPVNPGAVLRLLYFRDPDISGARERGGEMFVKNKS